MKAQISIEFLVMIAFTLLLFAIVLFIYFTQISETNASSDYLKAHRICLHTSSIISSFSAMRGNSTYSFELPESINFKNYTITIISNLSHVQIAYDNKLVGCQMLTKGITNRTGSTLFTMQKNATMEGYDGQITID